MASLQYCEPVEKTNCNQHPSLGQKVSEMANSVFKGQGSHHSHDQATQTRCYSQTETYYTDHGVEKIQTKTCYSQTEGHSPRHTTSCTSPNQCMSQTSCQQANHHASGAKACQGKTKTHKKRSGLLQKIKDGISGDSSSSDSESDDEKCGARKN
ncbi:hypothetical protein PTKIN_Ptkin04bG0177700 [Pterospermum kingtungense]